MSTHVVVLGAGAMGSLFGGLVAEGGLDVTLVDPWREHIDAIRQRGLRMVGHGGDRRISVEATTDPASVRSAGIIFVQCKANFNAAAAASVRHLFAEGGDTVAISFQNGLGNEEELAEYFDADRVLGGLTAQGANIEAPGIVRNHAELPSYIGEMKGGITKRTRSIAKMLTDANLPTEASENIRRDIWRKLMANIAISAVSGITGLNIGQIFNGHMADDVAYAALDEAIAVARACGIEMSSGEAREILEKIAGPDGTPQNKSSLRMDIENERPSEIDYINGAVVKLAREHGIAVPVNEALLALVHGMQHRYLG
ncbi:MAG: 2-dehydropantoate 2-reductase [Gammaproteobacteria bacterium]|nr:2-dehydropantoate 2-reductase [Gammaproteobacteria bacterium]MXY05319.1 2-dehydropantoate 2-reductase [Gammaproteobacteria bacterium]MYE53359.1 2-dehydropantoate 2-reductase [Gammaproteobacteria bacterium]MYF50127.1 2-dehydropantoate 2-reductase [Gammaproteobacteria bacterium]MYG12018.1 2-dehydropantoate 2-reductase [Gammaproteobacteria bacterium]